MIVSVEGLAIPDHQSATPAPTDAPYPDRVLDVLLRLLVAPRVVLDAGAGTGALARRMHGPYREDVLRAVKEHSEIEDHRETKELVNELRSSVRFAVEGEEPTEPTPFDQSVDDYIALLHSTSTLARIRLGEWSAGFDDRIRAVTRAATRAPRTATRTPPLAALDGPVEVELTDFSAGTSSSGAV